MSVYTVEPTGKLISGTFTRPYVIRNSSAVNVYLGQDSSLTPDTRAFTLTPGSTATWQGDTELWVCCDLGKVGSVEVIYTASFASTPGPDVVTTNNPTDVLAVHDGTLPVGTTVIAEIVELSKYQSLIVSCGDAVSAGGGATGDTARLVLEWTTLDGFVVATDAPYYYSNGTLSYTAQVKAPRVLIKVIASGVASVAVPVVVLGSSAQLERRYYSEPALIGRLYGVSGVIDNSVVSKQISVDYTLNTTQARVYLPSLSGEANCLFSNPTQMNASLIALPSLATSINVIYRPYGSGDLPVARILIPEKPIHMYTNQTATGSRQAFSITWS
jgi:hypothetical protein